MKYILTLIFLFIVNLSWGQGLLKSRIIQKDKTQVCTLFIWKDEDEPIQHPFKISTSTYLFPGDYKIAYLLKDKWLHAEWIHITKERILIEKIIFEKTIPLTEYKF